MGNVQKKNGSKTVKGSNGKIVGNLPAAATDGPAVAATIAATVEAQKAEYAATPVKFIELNEDEFDERFIPMTNPADGSMQFEYDEIVADGYDVHNVWTVVEGDDGGLYLTQGCHVVNRMYYMVTEMPWSDDEDIEVCLVEGGWSEEYCRDCGDYPTEELDDEGYCGECVAAAEEDAAAWAGVVAHTCSSVSLYTPGCPGCEAREAELRERHRELEEAARCKACGGDPESGRRWHQEQHMHLDCYEAKLAAEGARVIEGEGTAYVPDPDRPGVYHFVVTDATLALRAMRKNPKPVDDEDNHPLM